MSFAASQHHLRLVGGSNSGERPSGWADEQAARLAVTKENRIAAHAPGVQPPPGGFVRTIDPADPRWILAMQTQSRLQGATLTPDRRDELLKSGRKLGLRQFEANLVIAIVQDQARQGTGHQASGTSAQCLVPDALSSAGPMLALVRPPADRERSARPAVWPQWLAALAAAAAVAAALIRWLAA